MDMYGFEYQSIFRFRFGGKTQTGTLKWHPWLIRYPLGWDVVGGHSLDATPPLGRGCYGGMGGVGMIAFLERGNMLLVLISFSHVETYVRALRGVGMLGQTFAKKPNNRAASR